MDPSTAVGAYGFTSYTPANPGGIAIAPETQVGTTGAIPAGVFDRLPLFHNNPLFWLLVLFLIWSGYLFGTFDVGIKKIGRETFKVG